MEQDGRGEGVAAVRLVAPRTRLRGTVLFEEYRYTRESMHTGVRSTSV